MKFWLDAQISPKIALWLQESFDVEAVTLRSLGLRDAEDEIIFYKARSAQAVLITKDLDFISLQERLGPPPQIIWLTCGNTSNIHLQQVFATHFPSVAHMLELGEPLIELA